MKIPPCFLLFLSLLSTSNAFHTPSLPISVTKSSPVATNELHISNTRPNRLFASTNADSSEEWTEKRLHNTSQFRAICILAAMLGAGFKLPLSKVPTRIMASVHLLSFATWLGMVNYTTFVAGITMFKNLPRQTFGKLQSKLFPKYFAISSVSLVLQLVTLKSLQISGTIAHASAKSLGVALLMTLANQFYLEPKSTSNMMRRYELDNAGQQESDEYKTLKASFGKFHGLSSLTNLVALCAGVAHACFLSVGFV